MKQEGIICEANKSDRPILDKFLQQYTSIHRHLDWRQPREWLGRSPFLLYLSPENTIEAVLNCVPEPQDIYWIRLFAIKNPSHRILYWKALFNAGLEIITDQSSDPTIASLAYEKWMKDLLEMEGWVEKQRVIQFRWDDRKKTEVFRSVRSSPFIRQMTRDDIGKVASIDQTCFHPLWQQSQEALEHAYAQSTYSTVFELDQSICGFQISTSDNGKAHLARLAVLPDFQKQHIGEKLVLDMLQHIDDNGIKDISVNTQQDNYNSIGLYKKLQFKKIGDSFPIYFYS